MSKHSIILAFGLLIVHSTSGLAQSSEIRVGTGEFPPFTTETTAAQGCVIKIVRSAFESEGWGVSVKFLPWPRNLVMLSRGEIDASAYWADRPDRRQEYIFPENPVTSEVYKFVFRADSRIEWDSYEDLSGKEIIINSDYTYTDEFYKAFDRYGIKAHEVASEDQNLGMILRGRGDLTILSEKVFEKYIMELSAEQQSRLYLDTRTALVTLGFLVFSRANSERSEKMAAVFDSGYDKIRKRDDLQEHFKTCGF